MRWSRMSRPLMSVVRMQSSNIASSKVIRIDELKSGDKLNENNIVAAAFASLKEIDNAKSKTSAFFITNNKIDNARTVEELLAITETETISKQHALKVSLININFKFISTLKFDFILFNF